MSLLFFLTHNWKLTRLDFIQPNVCKGRRCHRPIQGRQKSMAKKLLHYLVAPAAVITAVLFFCQPLYYPAGGKPDYILMLLLIGIPFGIHRMFVWFIPKGYDLGGTVGIIVFDILVGGIIGVFVLIWKIIAGMGCLALCITKLIVKIIQQREA